MPMSWKLFCLILCGLMGVPNLQAAENTYTNPVIAQQGLADPAILHYQGKYYMYPTGGTRQGYLVYLSDDLVHWTRGPLAFDSKRPKTWAPDVFYNPTDKKIYLYYAANLTVGVAVADRPEGPFEEKGVLLKNAIDPHMFRDDDGKYFLYYVDLTRGNRIFVQPMASPVKTQGEPRLIIEATEAWETCTGRVAEGPWMIKHDGKYYMMYSGSDTSWPSYAIGYAVAANPMGPFVKYKGNPIVHQGGGVYGPGHNSATQDARGNWWLIYHQKVDAGHNSNRFFCIDPLWFDKDGVLHGKATRGTAEKGPETGK